MKYNIPESMSNTMKQYIIENKTTIISIVVCLLLFVSVWYKVLEQNNAIKLAKQELLKEQSKPSAADIITNTILYKKNTIVVTEVSIQELESKKRKLELEVTCWKNQMNRLVDWLEYNLEYCKDENNLNKFKYDYIWKVEEL